MKLITALVGVLILFGFVSSILFVLLGQVTVRKLRKIPETKRDLGIEFASGWDIINVAVALSMLKMLEKHLKNKAFHANTDLLYRHTTVFDRVLARVFCGLWIFTGLSVILLGLLDAIGVFD